MYLCLTQCNLPCLCHNYLRRHLWFSKYGQLLQILYICSTGVLEGGVVVGAIGGSDTIILDALVFETNSEISTFVRFFMRRHILLLNGKVHRRFI